MRDGRAVIMSGRRGVAEHYPRRVVKDGTLGSSRMFPGPYRRFSSSEIFELLFKIVT